MDNFNELMEELRYRFDGFNNIGHLLSEDEYKIMLKEAKAGNDEAAHMIYRTLKTYFLFMINTYGRHALAKNFKFFDDLQTTNFRIFSTSIFSKFWTLCEGAVFSVISNYDLDNPKELPFTFYLGLEIKSLFESKLQNELYEVIAELEEVDTNKKEVEQHEDVSKMLISQPTKLFLRFCKLHQATFMLLHNVLGVNIRRACNMSKISFSDIDDVATFGIDELKKVIDMELVNFPASFDELGPAKQIRVAHHYGYMDGNISLDEIKKRYEEDESYIYMLKQGVAELAENALSTTYDPLNAEDNYESISLQNTFNKMAQTNDLSERVKIIQQYSYEFGGILGMMEASRNFAPAVKEVFDEDIMLSEQLKSGVAKEYTEEEINSKSGYIGEMAYLLLKYKRYKKETDDYANAHGGYKFLSDVYTQGLSDKNKYAIQQLVLDSFPPISKLEDYHSQFGTFFSRKHFLPVLTEKVNLHISHLKNKQDLVNKMGGIENISERFFPKLNDIEKYIFLKHKIGAGHSYYKQSMSELGIDEDTYEKISKVLNHKIEVFIDMYNRIRGQNQPQ